MLYNFGHLGDPCPCVAAYKEQYLAAPTVQASLFFLKNVMLQVNMLGLNYSFLVIITFAMTKGNLTFIMGASVRLLLFD